MTLGLDIGCDTIKGVRMARTLWGFRLIDSFGQKVLRDGPSSDLLTDGQIAALKSLMRDGKIRPDDQIAVSLPGHLVSARTMTLPFVDLKRLAQVIPYEVEGQLPFNIEDVSIGYQVLHLNKNESPANAFVLVFAVPRATLRRFLEMLKELGIDPILVTVDAVPLHAFYRYLLDGKREKTRQGSDLPGRCLLIDMGASKTVLAHIQDGKLTWVRTLTIGGDVLTEALRSRCNLSFGDAEKLKREIHINKESSFLSREALCLKEAIAPLFTEIEKTVHLTGGATHPPFYLCGGAAGLKGLKELFATVLEMKPVLSEGDLRLEADATAPLAQGLALIGCPKDAQINFRRGEFALKKEAKERNLFVSVGLMLLFVFAFMVGDFYLHCRYKERQYQGLKGQLRGAFSDAFPQIRNVPSELGQIKTAIAALHRTGEFLGIGEVSPLVVLKALTSGIPADVPIDVTDLVIDGNRVRMEAQTASFDSVDKVRGNLTKVALFRDVNVSDAKVAADPSRVGFRVQMTVAIGRGD